VFLDLEAALGDRLVAADLSDGPWTGVLHPVDPVGLAPRRSG